MAEEKKKYNDYHLNVQMSRTFFSYKKPGDGGAYALMYVTYYNGMISLHFKRGITSENVLDLNCYLNDGKAYDLSRLLEGIMGRRVPTTSFRDGKEVATGVLVIDTEMYDGIPRIRVSYTDSEKNETIEIVFNSRVPSGPIEAKCKANMIDYADIQAFEFVNVLKELQNPMVPIMYRIQDAAVGSLSRFIKSCLGGGNRNNSNPTYNQNVGPQTQSWETDEPF